MKVEIRQEHGLRAVYVNGILTVYAKSLRVAHGFIQDLRLGMKEQRKKRRHEK
jgi:hypothetical protein